MASNGLFTQGLSVDDLLAQRSKRYQAQQQLMADNAAQGARDPQRARMGSMFGSIIGRALGNNAQGGGDAEMEKLKAAEARRQELVGQNIQARGGDSAAMFAHAKVLNDDPSKRYTKAALDMTDKAVAKQKEEDDAVAAVAKVAKEDAEKLAKVGNKKQVSGATLNALQGTTNYDPNTMYQVDEVTGGVSSIGSTGVVATPKPVSTTSREITEAYNVKPNTPEHEKLMQQALAIGELTIGDIKSVTEGWRTETSQETDRISTAKELLGLLELEGLDPKTKKISVVADRLVSRLFGGSDTKAQAEIETFRSTGDIGNRLASAATMFLDGTYNADTLEGFKELAKFSLNNNTTSYNNKLGRAIERASMASNLDVTKATALFGDPLEMYSEPKKQRTVEGTTIDVGGVTYRSLGGDETDPDNWVEVK